MNERQRKLLVESVKATFTIQKEALEAQIPQEPSMSNHVVAALLNNTLKIHSSEKILEALRKRALAMSGNKDKDLVEVEETYNYRRSKNNIKIFVKMIPDDLFEMPPTYQEEWDKYQAKKTEIDEKLHSLELQLKTITLKIEVGSAKHLEGLVMQIDGLGSLDLISNKLLLGASEEEVKKLGSGS